MEQITLLNPSETCTILSHLQTFSVFVLVN